MMMYYLKNRDNPVDAIECADNWKVYTERGDLVCNWIVHGRETITY